MDKLGPVLKALLCFGGAGNCANGDGPSGVARAPDPMGWNSASSTINSAVLGNMLPLSMPSVLT